MFGIRKPSYDDLLTELKLKEQEFFKIEAQLEHAEDELIFAEATYKHDFNFYQSALNDRIYHPRSNNAANEHSAMIKARQSRERRDEIELNVKTLTRRYKKAKRAYRRLQEKVESMQQQ